MSSGKNLNQETTEPLTKTESELDNDGNTPTSENAIKTDSESEITSDKKEDNDKIKIKFTHPMPSFLWTDNKEYGPYDVGDEIEIFSEVADLIVKKGRAEKVS